MEDEDNDENGVYEDTLSTEDDGSDSSNSSAGDGDHDPVLQSTLRSRSANRDRENLNITFDNALPIKHSYLGDNLEELSGRTLFEEGSIQILPIIILSGVVLVPGQTLPLDEFDPKVVSMLRNAVATDRTFGVVCHKQDMDQPMDNYIADVGTTAEIYAWEEVTSSPTRVEFRVKTHGRQRFRLIQLQNRQPPYVAKVLILRERNLPDMLHDLSPRSLAPGARSRALRKQAAMCTAWPDWVHTLYDTDTLAARLRSKITELYNQPHQKLHMPSDAIQLSYWAAQSLPLRDEQRVRVIRKCSAIQRLRIELSLIDRCQVLACRQCQQPIANPKDVFSMSAEGPQGTYVNPGGYVHETMTLHRARGLFVQFQQPSYEYSWFPGYGWTMVSCSGCDKHMGWLFTTKKPELRPKRFFGLCRNSLSVNLRGEDEDEEFREESVHRDVGVSARSAE